MLFYKGTAEIIDDILGTLKVVFSVDEDFNYDLANPRQSYLKIWDAYPKTENIAYPCIICVDSTMSPKPVGIGQELRQQSYIGDTQAYEHGGKVDFTINLECVTRSSLERQQLGDKVTMALWWITRKYLEEGGIIVLEVDQSGQEEKTDEGSNPIFIKKITMKVWVEWSEFVSYDEISSVSVIMREIRHIKRLNGVSMDDAILSWAEKIKGE